MLFSQKLYKPVKNHLSTDAYTSGMELSYLFICLRLALGLIEMNSALVWNDSRDTMDLRAGCTEARADCGVGISTEASTVKCKLQGTARLPAFSVDGDYNIGGVFSIHHYMNIVKHNYTTIPEPLRCTGRLV